MMTQDKQAEIIGRIPSGLFILTVDSGSSIDGYLVSFVQQVSIEPIMIAIAVKKGRDVLHVLKDGRTFSLNIVGQHDKSYLKLFWKGYDEDHNPFDTLPYSVSPHGGISLHQALGSIDLVRETSIDTGDHELVIARVVDSFTIETHQKPVFHTRKNGLQY